MRRVLAYSKWRAAWWTERVNMRTGLSLALQEGLRAYALRQASIHEARVIHFQSEWSMPSAQAQNLPATIPDWVTHNSGDADDDDFADE